ncbi:hypothetical protein N7532_000222 [Penicillium argentinense]|uniref:Glutaredoxin domain-containing protein n=1 Tax=Penicillium argentinense TaxID=1131581 RepID=A0A9W9G6C9_9EURO|nr:uncharacterized protein N7532_000222 [Penicillium argentinense]KAJ5112177.1 hypothetical protein N7532_000222 [Penicillium argentinense]
MASQRRVRLTMIAVVVIIFMFFYYSGEASKIQNQEFYQSTLKAMRAKEAAKKETPQQPIVRPGENAQGAPAGSANIERPAVPAAKDKVVAGTPEMEDIPIAGRTKMTVPKNKDQGVQDSSRGSEKTEEEVVDHTEAKSELNDILKRAPVIIFSKSYCPYSKRAKHILLDRYSISPKPFVVELDQHPIGPGLQDLLAQNTGRRTVPNVLVNGKSIGGGDDIAALDQSDELASTLRQMGGKWISDIKAVPVAAEAAL